jgi:LysR family hydrogen peroxide-inducible transcriptional activator
LRHSDQRNRSIDHASQYGCLFHVTFVSTDHVLAADSRARQPTLAQLRAFAAVAEHLHFRQAAAVLGMSQPALSGAVSALEEVLGVTLVERTTRKVLLSAAGERLAVRARGVLAEVAGLQEEAETLRAPFTGTLRLGVIPTVAPYLLPTVLDTCARRYPDLALEVHEEQTAALSEGLAAGRLDVLLLALPLSTPGFTEIPLFDEDFVLVTPREHPLAGQEGLARDVLTGLPLLLLAEGHCLRDQALDVCRDAGRGDAKAVTTTAAGLSTLVQLVAGGLGVTLLPRTAVALETGRNERLATAAFAEPSPSRRIGLVRRDGAARGEQVAELGRVLRGAFGDLPVRVAA